MLLHDRALPLPSARLALALKAQARTLEELAQHVHASWLAPLGLQSVADAPCSDTAGRARLWARLWARALGVHDVPPAALATDIHHMATLAPSQALQALRLRALLHRRRTLRAALSPGLSERGCDWVGALAWQALLHDAPAALHDAPLPAGDIASLSTALAWEGWCRLQSEPQWQASPAARLLRLRFARTLMPVRVGPAEPALTHWLAGQLDGFYPAEAPEAAP